MTKEQFLKGLKVFWASGGANPDEDTLEIWYQMLSHIVESDYQKAIIHLMRNEKNLATINFIAEIEERAKMFKGQREAEARYNVKQIPPKDIIPRDKLKKLVKDFTKSLGDIPKVTDEN